MDAQEIRKLTSVEDRHWWYAERRSVLRRLLRDKRRGTALDVGAAGGGNTRELIAKGWQPVALEYSADGAEVAHERGMQVVRADATRLPFPSESFDLVTALDILEHIPDHEAAAAEIYRTLRPGGSVIIAVPIDPELWSAHDTAVNHVRRYTRTELVSLLENAGLVIDDVLPWMVLLRPVVKWRRNSTSGSDLDEPSWPVNTVLRGIVMVERVLPLKSARSVSLWVSAHRP